MFKKRWVKNLTFLFSIIWGLIMNLSGIVSMDNTRTFESEMITTGHKDIMMCEAPIEGDIEETFLEESITSYSPYTLSNDSFQVTTIRSSGKPDNESIVLVFMGEGFTAYQQGSWPNPAKGSFLGQVLATSQTLLKTKPFSEFEDLFTIYAVHVISPQSGITGYRPGVGIDTSYTVDTYFNAYFEKASSIRMLSLSRTKAKAIANSVSNSVDMIQVIANADTHGGVTWIENNYNHSVGVTLVSTQMSDSSKNPWTIPWHGTSIHELGHAFGSLADEHETANRYDWAANMSSVSDSDTIKWSHWLGKENIQIRTFSDGWSVPAAESKGCIMRASWSHNEFCAVCSAELTRRLAYISGETFQSKSHYTDGTYLPDLTHDITTESDSNRIVPYAFNGNPTMLSLTITSEVDEIGRYAFIGVSGLLSIINLNPEPQIIDSTTFSGVERADINLVIPAGTAQAYIAAGWTGFNLYEGRLPYEEYLVIENNVLTGFNAPNNFNGHLIIPNTVTCINTTALSYCEELVCVNFEPNSQLTEIGGYVFESSVNLKSLKIPVTVQTIGWSIFINCMQVTVYTELSTAPTGWNASWNVTYVDYNAMREDMLNGVVQESSYYWSYAPVNWGYTN